MRPKLTVIACAVMLLTAPFAAHAAQTADAPTGASSTTTPTPAAGPAGPTGSLGATGTTGSQPESGEERQREVEEAAGEVEEADEELSSPGAVAAEIAEVLRRVEQETAEEEAAKRQATTGQRCVVPKLKGDRLRRAEHALSREHCRLGKVTAPRGRHARLVVVRQSRHPGEHLADRATVSVKLGVPGHRG